MKKLLIIFLFLFKNSIGQDTTVLKRMTGIWRWTSGNRDTLIIVVKPTKLDKYGRNQQADFFGYHTYIEKGQLVESSMLASDDTAITKHTTLSGYVYTDKIGFVLYDITRDNRLSFQLQLINNREDIAWLIFSGMDHRWVTDENKKQYPPGKTIPSDVILRKISDRY